VGTPSEFPQYGHQLHGPAGEILNQRLGPISRVEGETDWIGGIVDCLSGSAELGQAVQVGEMSTTQLGAAGEVDPTCLSRLHDCLSRVPHVCNQGRVEVAERAGHDEDFHVAEYSARPRI
jgi:hypothetical protein